MALPVGFISTNKINAGKNFNQSSTLISEVRIETIGDSEKRIFIWNGNATPSSPIELVAKQNYNIIKYPGLNDQQAQILGIEYDPIILSGKIDAQDLQRGISKLKYEISSSEIVWYQNKRPIDQFFDQLKDIQEKGYQIKLIASVFDPQAIYNQKYFKDSALPSDIEIVNIGETTTDIRCVILEIKYSCHIYGVWDYNITLIPISPSNQKFKRTTIEQKKTPLKTILDAKNKVDGFIRDVNDVLDTTNYYYDEFVHNSLATLSQELNKFQDIADRTINLVNLPASAIDQTLNVCYSVKTWAEDFSRDCVAVKSRYTKLKNLDWEWEGPVVSSGEKALTEVSSALYSQLDLSKSSIFFGNNFEDSLKKSLEKRIYNSNDQLSIKFAEVVQEINKFEARYEQKELDKQIRRTISQLMLSIKRFIRENEVKSPYTLYVCKQHDTLRSLAVKSYNDVNKWRQIADFNNLDGDNLTSGQQIKIPVL